jgi:2-dehydropantoate 2-reductase
MIKDIVVFGIGGIGGFLGAHLADACEGSNRTLTFVARGAHLAAIQRNGLRFRDPAGDERIVRPTRAVATLTDADPADVVFICVKGYGLTAACEAIRPVVGPDTVVVPLLNGADIHERVRAVISSGTVLPAAIYISSAIDEAGTVHHRGGAGNIVVGPEPGDTEFDPAPLLELLDEAEIPHEWFADALPAIWTKFLFIASFGLTTALSNKPLGGVVADPELAETTRAIQREIVELARARGIALPGDAAEDAFRKGSVFPPETTTSFQRDVARAGAPNEGDLFGGTIIALGRELGVPVPVAERVYREIEGRS